MRPQHDYVLVGRRVALWPAISTTMLDDLRSALTASIGNLLRRNL